MAFGFSPHIGNGLFGLGKARDFRPGGFEKGVKRLLFFGDAGHELLAFLAEDHAFELGRFVLKVLDLSGLFGAKSGKFGGVRRNFGYNSG